MFNQLRCILKYQLSVIFGMHADTTVVRNILKLAQPSKESHTSSLSWVGLLLSRCIYTRSLSKPPTPGCSGTDCNSGSVGIHFSSFLLEEPQVFVVRFCSAGPKEPLEVQFPQLRTRGEVKLMLSLFSLCSLVAL